MPRRIRSARDDGRVTSPRSFLRRYPYVVALVAVLVLVLGGARPCGDRDSTGPRRAAAAAEQRCTADDLAGRWTSVTLHLDARSVGPGKTVLAVRGDEPTQTGSTMKLVTASAALAALGRTTGSPPGWSRGPTPTAVVLVGGGDPTLSRLPSGQDSVYPGAPHLDDLARQVRAAHPGADRAWCGSTPTCSTARVAPELDRERPHERQRLEHHRAHGGRRPGRPDRGVLAAQRQRGVTGGDVLRGAARARTSGSRRRP